MSKINCKYVKFSKNTKRKCCNLKHLTKQVPWWHLDLMGMERDDNPMEKFQTKRQREKSSKERKQINVSKDAGTTTNCVAYQSWEDEKKREETEETFDATTDFSRLGPDSKVHFREAQRTLWRMKAKKCYH